MTEIESGTARFNAGPLTPLRGATSASDLLVGSSGSLDAFSEVFARMAESSPPPPPVQDTETKPAAEESDDVKAADDDVQAQDQDETSVDANRSPTSADHVVSDASSQEIATESSDDQETVDVQEAHSTDPAGEVRDIAETEPSEANKDVLPDDEDSADSVVAAQTETIATPETAPLANTADEDVKTTKTQESDTAVVAIPAAENGPATGSGSTDSETEPADTPTATQGDESPDGGQQRDDSRGSDRFAVPGEGRFGVPQSQSNGSAASGFEIDAANVQSPNSQGQNETTPPVSESTNAAPVAPTQPANPTGETTPAQPSAASPTVTTAVAQPSSPTADATTARPQDTGQVATEMRLNGTAEAKAKATGETTNVSDLANRVKLLQRVSKAFQHAGADGGNIRIRLAPDELGTVRIEMQVQDKQIRARVVTESEAASQALRENMHELKNRLETQGVSVEQIDIETDTGDSSFGRFHGRQHSGQGRASRDDSHRQGSRDDSMQTATENNVQADQAIRSRHAAASGRVDLVL